MGGSTCESFVLEIRFREVMQRHGYVVNVRQQLKAETKRSLVFKMGSLERDALGAALYVIGSRSLLRNYMYQNYISTVRRPATFATESRNAMLERRL